ncbi:hypothetical protein CJA_0989 [Cellvibrio japonicus Ueda107]|uniref:Uncharacterized protein n=1 Tax=Cellvibrio japonicus (strain Ueda107) TaxID=498211 RepID=B3PB17_CELJU|nr:hypothetical protein CJA_0989 [Cellvibrio japonicus Ueda107]
MMNKLCPVKKASNCWPFGMVSFTTTYYNTL